MTQHVLSLSYGKDSLACLGAIEQLGWPLDRIVHAEVWATDTIPADPPPMMEFKRHADEIILKRYGIQVEHVFATKKDRAGGAGSRTHTNVDSTIACSAENSPEHLRDSLLYVDHGVKNSKSAAPMTYESIFYRPRRLKQGGVAIHGFPTVRGPWCNSYLKVPPLRSLASQPNGLPTAPENSKSQPSHLPPNFQQAPHHRGPRKILWCSTWALRLTSRSVLPDWMA